MDNHKQLKQLESSLKLVGAQGRETLRVGPFEVYLSVSTNPTMSFATSHTDVSDWSDAVDALKQLFSGRGRLARLEYFHELYPLLVAALEAAGFRQDMTAPVMTLTPDALPPTQSPASSQASTQNGYRHLEADETERLRAFLRQQTVAYGGGADDEGALAWLPQLTDGLRSGAVIMAGLEENGGFVSGATVQIGGEVGELAGVWTRPELQQQGRAYALCQRLLTDYFAAGYGLCWLSAAEGAAGLYERLGFRRVGTQLNYECNSGDQT